VHLNSGAEKLSEYDNLASRNSEYNSLFLCSELGVQALANESANSSAMS
jgi:hypothetical protein